MNEKVVPIYVAPLGISALNEPMPENVSHEAPDVAFRLLGEMVGDHEDPLAAARRRYREVIQEVEELGFAPMHEVIMRHVIAPLNDAIRCYVLGMPVASIAQAGLVGEMVALWRFQMLALKLDGRPSDADLQQLLQGREFEKLGQDERVRVLKAVDSLDQELIDAFGQLRSLRRQYLHFMFGPPRDMNKDARDAIRYAATLVVRTLGATLSADGMVVFPPRVAEFIKDICRTESDSSSPQSERTASDPPKSQEI